MSGILIINTGGTISMTASSRGYVPNGKAFRAQLEGTPVASSIARLSDFVYLSDDCFQTSRTFRSVLFRSAL